MLCQVCNKNEANIHYSVNINGNTKERHLCSDCMKKMNFKNIFNIPDFLKEDNFSDSMMKIMNGSENTRDEDVMEALNSMMKIMNGSGAFSDEFGADFMKNGLFSSATGNNFFENLLPSIFDVPETKEIKIPVNVKKENPEIIELKKELNEAIKNEEYEKAAEIRDKIKEKNE